jgi:hypothetical protein
VVQAWLVFDRVLPANLTRLEALDGDSWDAGLFLVSTGYRVPCRSGDGGRHFFSAVCVGKSSRLELWESWPSAWMEHKALQRWPLCNLQIPLQVRPPRHLLPGPRLPL